jgi:tRNA-2-methylthio-N6-dimethylallyladenosine synthase
MHDHQRYWIDTELSKEELYEDLMPVRFNVTSAWIAIMRGCDNFCSYCVVPFTRGRERSRSVTSIIQEVRQAVEKGITEIGLLGQNVNSFNDQGKHFTDLMKAVSDIPGVRRIRFTSPHPKDLSVELIHLIAERDNICKHIHLPVQSGSDRILQLMNRSYTRSDYLDLVRVIRSVIPGVALTTDLIAGFPTETDDDHEATMDLYRQVQFDTAFTFIYSPRPGTKAFDMNDDVPSVVKNQRLSELIKIQRHIGLSVLHNEIGNVTEALIEAVSKKSEQEYACRTDKFQTVIIPRQHYNIGDYVNVRLTHTQGHTLFGIPV